MNQVTLEQAQRLAALGFPQPHPGICTMRWVARWGVLTPMDEPPDHWELRYQMDPRAIEPHLRGRTSYSLVAPVYVSGDGESGALEWAEREHGWHWGRSADGKFWCAPGGRGTLWYTTASELLDAMLDTILTASDNYRHL